MRSLALALALVVAAGSVLPGVAEARRIGGGGAVGMQRSLPPRGTGRDARAPRRTHGASRPRHRPRRRRRPRRRAVPGSVRSPASPRVSASRR